MENVDSFLFPFVIALWSYLMNGWILSILFYFLSISDMVLPIMHSTSSENMPIILGSLHCIRSVIPFLTDATVLNKTTNGTEPDKAEQNIKLDSTIMVMAYLRLAYVMVDKRLAYPTGWNFYWNLNITILLMANSLNLKTAHYCNICRNLSMLLK